MQQMSKRVRDVCLRRTFQEVYRMQESEDAARVRFFPPGIPLLAILAGSLADRFVRFDVAFIPDAPLRFFIGATIFLAALLGLGVWSIVLFRAHGQDANPWKKTPAIEQRGPYQITRNPMYLMMLLICVSAGVAFVNGWILLLVPVAGWSLLRLVIQPEETYLEAKFGEEYLDYKRRVRRWI